MGPRLESPPPSGSSLQASTESDPLAYAYPLYALLQPTARRVRRH